jgi:hypothetical protein
LSINSLTAWLDAPQPLVGSERRDHCRIEHQVRLIMEIVGADRDRSGAGDHPALVSQQAGCCDHGGERHRDAPLGVGRGRAGQQPLHGAVADEQGRCGNQHHLAERHQSLGLAMTKPVVVIGGKRGDANAGQGHEAGDDVESGVGKAAEHGRRVGRNCRPQFGNQQRDGDCDAGQGGSRRQPGAVMGHRSDHG